MANQSAHSSQLTHFQAREYEEGINDLLIRARLLVNSFHVTVRAPPEILTMICSCLATEEDTFLASQVCRHWRAVIISSPSLWTRFPCRHVPRTIAGLERCKSMPIQLMFDRELSSMALEKVLLHGNEIVSLTVKHSLGQFPLSDQLFTFPRQSLERLHICSKKVVGWEDQGRATRELWQDLPSLRKLFIRRYSTPIEQLTAPNLAHLALEETGYGRSPTIQSILDMLRGCPLLETLLIILSNVRRDPTRDHPPVFLPYLRSIELGEDELFSGLTTHLQFPQNAAVGFRMACLLSEWVDIPLAAEATMQHVLRRIDIRRITLLVAPSDYHGGAWLLVRFEGLSGSLEITSYSMGTGAQIRDAFFGPRGVLFSQSPHIEGVREVNIVGCSFEGDQEFHHIHMAMPELVSISFFRCEGLHVFGLLTPTNTSSPPFPNLERVMVLGSESGLREMAKARRDCGVPLKTLAVGRGPRRYEDLEDYTALGKLVGHLHIDCPIEVLEWGTENEILNIWHEILNIWSRTEVLEHVSL